MRLRNALAPALAAASFFAPGELMGQGSDAVVEVAGAFDYDWSVRTSSGAEIELEALRGEVLVVNFWATWCAPCVAELGSFARLEAQLEERAAAVRFLYVSPEDPSLVEDFGRRHAQELELVTEARRAPASLGELVLPTTFVVNRAGEIVLRHRGASDWGQSGIADFLASLAPISPDASR